LVGFIYKDGKALPVNCGRWDCQNCARQKGKAAWIKIMKSKASGFQRLLTLPFYVGNSRSWMEAIDISGKALNHFFTLIRRKFGKLDYVWVREVGRKSNMVHFHILIGRYLPKKALLPLWKRAGGGSVVDIGFIRTSASYVSKYLVKFPHYSESVSMALAGKRRYSSSRGLLYKPMRSPSWAGAKFSNVAPWLILKKRVLAVLDGVFYYEPEGFT